MSADAEGDGFSVDAEWITGGIDADSGFAPFGLSGLPFEFGELESSGGPSELRFSPVCPITAEAVSGVRDNEVQVAYTADIGLQRDDVSGCVGGDHGAGSEWPWRGGGCRSGRCREGEDGECGRGSELTKEGKAQSHVGISRGPVGTVRRAGRRRATFAGALSFPESV